MLAYDYPLLGAFWTVFWIFIWVAWIILLFRVFVDIFRSHDMGGWAKGLWAIFVILVPFLGVFVYLIARGGKMQERDIENARAQEQQFQGYVRDVAGSGDVADQLTKLSSLRDQGVISEDEFAAQKAKLLA
jgi:Short C-terminal domain